MGNNYCEAAHAGNIDDAALLLPGHGSESGLRADEHAEHVQLINTLEIGDACFLRGAQQRQTCIVDQDVQPAPGIHDSVHGAVRAALGTLGSYTTTPSKGYAVIWEGWVSGAPVPQAPL